MIGWLRFRWARLKWFWLDSPRFGGPELGATREERNRNIHLLLDRWNAKEPKWEDYR